MKNTGICLTLIKNLDKVGDCDQIDGLTRSTLAHFKNKSIPVQEKTLKTDELSLDNLQNSSIIITAGVDGARSLLKANQENILPNNCLKVCLTHEWDPIIERLIISKENPNGANIIALPSHAGAENIFDKLSLSPTSLIQTTGVCHNYYVEDITKEFLLYKNEFPSYKKTIAIVLAGDVKDANNCYYFFTTDEAKKLGEYMAQYLQLEENKEANLIIINSPRTGKYNPLTLEENITTHRGDIDPVTKIFLKTLANKGIKNISLFDYQHGAANKFKAILGALESTLKQSEIFIPGESVSMISQVLDVLNKTSITIYENNAMNQYNIKHIDNTYVTGRITILTKDYQLRLAKIVQAKDDAYYKPARDIVTEKIYAVYTHKFYIR